MIIYCLLYHFGIRTHPGRALRHTWQKFQTPATTDSMQEIRSLSPSNQIHLNRLLDSVIMIAWLRWSGIITLPDDLFLLFYVRLVIYGCAFYELGFDCMPVLSRVHMRPCSSCGTSVSPNWTPTEWTSHLWFWPELGLCWLAMASPSGFQLLC